MQWIEGVIAKVKGHYSKGTISKDVVQGKRQERWCQLSCRRPDEAKGWRMGST